MSELLFSEYEADARKTAFFLDDPSPQARFEKIYYGFNEEVDELLYDPRHPGALSSVLLGRTVLDESVTSELVRDKVSEAGDVLYYITAAGMLHDVPLEAVARKSLDLYTSHTHKEEDLSFEDFEAAFFRQIESASPPEVQPNYFGMQFWNLSPFRAGRHDQFQPSKSIGPMVLSADMRYALERTARAFSETIMPSPYIHKEDFLANAGLLLGALSIALQHRFNSSLEDSAINNIAKRVRRMRANSLASGEDAERSRVIGEPKPRITGFENTLANLVFAATPS